MAVSTEDREIECRFLEINKEALIKKLRELGAEDKGEVMLEETIVYNEDLSWANQGRRVRIRKGSNGVTLAYKERLSPDSDDQLEIEFGVNDYSKAEIFLEKIGLRAHRKQQKLRHTFHMDGATIDIDTWPRVPAYAEIEADSDEKLKITAEKLGFDWSRVVFKNAGKVLEEVYDIPIRRMRYFTFDRYE